MTLVNYHLTVAKNIKKLCKLKEISYSELSRKSGIELNTLQKLLYSQDRKDPRISTIHKIAKALNVSIDKLVK